MDKSAKAWDPSSPEAMDKFREELKAKGWVWNEQLNDLVPPGTTEEHVQQVLAANRMRAEKHRQTQAKVNSLTWVLLIGFVLALFYAPWLWMVLTIGMVVLGVLTSWGGGKGGDDYPGGAGKMGPF